MKILLIDYCDNILIENLNNNHFECLYEPLLKEKEILRKISRFEGIIFRNKIFADKTLIDKGKNLKFIASLDSQPQNIDFEYASKKGIVCFSVNGQNHNSVAEHAIAMLLNLFNYMCRSNMQVKNGIWKREANKGIEIWNKTIGIIGYARTGRAFAQRLSGFGVKVLAYDKFKKDYSDEYCMEASLNDLHENCDIISLHIPLTEENKHFVDYQFIKQFRKNIYLINTSHGLILKTEDLTKALSKGKVLGAALDVLEFENSAFEKLHFGTMPESIQYLIDSDNVMFSPHISGWTKESEYRSAIELSNLIIESFNPQKQ